MLNRTLRDPGDDMKLEDFKDGALMAAFTSATAALGVSAVVGPTAMLHGEKASQAAEMALNYGAVAGLSLFATGLTAMLGISAVFGAIHKVDDMLYTRQLKQKNIPSA